MRKMILIGVMCASWGLVMNATTVVHDGYSVDVTRVLTGLCPFPVTEHETGDVHDALFFDDAGNLVRVLETLRHFGTTYTANGVTLEARVTGGLDFTFNPDGTIGSFSIFGINNLLTIPHDGAVFLNTGVRKGVFDPTPQLVFQAGPLEFDIPAFCAALSGE